jgi:hypothetical protein
MADTLRAQLVQLISDRRLGHEWDEWDGTPLPDHGSFDSPPSLFFAWALATGALVGTGAALCIFLLAPRLALINSAIATGAWWTWLAITAVFVAWWVLLGLAYVTRRPLLPGKLAERGALLGLMYWTSRVAKRFKHRDRVENAAVKVYNRLALARARKVGKGEMLLLVPRCLSKEALDGVLSIAGKHDVPIFVAARGKLARQAIRERRPRAVVAVACERDLVSGLHDVAGRVPVLGLTMTLPSGPCKGAEVNLAHFEEWVKAFTD